MGVKVIVAPLGASSITVVPAPAKVTVKTSKYPVPAAMTKYVAQVTEQANSILTGAVQAVTAAEAAQTGAEQAKVESEQASTGAQQALQDMTTLAEQIQAVKTALFAVKEVELLDDLVLVGTDPAYVFVTRPEPAPVPEGQEPPTEPVVLLPAAGFNGMSFMIRNRSTTTLLEVCDRNRVPIKSVDPGSMVVMMYTSNGWEDLTGNGK